MNEAKTLTRRDALRRLAFGVALAPLAAASWRQAAAADAASLPLLSVDAPEAKAVKYVENAQQAKDKVPGRSCANCGLYQGATGSTQGPCQLFPGKAVKAAGWCSSWAAQL
jgi:ribosomal protein L32